MPKQMLVNVVNEEESRIAIVSDNLLEELSIEIASHEHIEGNIYKAKIVKILPSLGAVFVDYGRSRNGFLALQDIHPKYFANGGRGTDALRNGQELMVQVRKGEIGQKGAALTTYVSIPGRYIVLMPFVGKRGVSRKIQDDEARREMKQVVDEAGIPEDMGYIVRTAGMEQTKQDLARDVGYLLRLWKKIQAQHEKAKGPSLLYQESDIVIRTIRDYFTPTIQEVWVDNEEICEQVRSFFRTLMPWYQKRVRLYQEKAPLFTKFNLEGQIASISEKTVPLPSGGSIVIEQTEALVSVDVNSGKTTKGKDIDETAFIANREAAEEVSRQLRLRDLGGLVVIDFIDMKSSSRRNEIRKILQKALKQDKARTDVGTISKFGMLELSRQRIKPAGLRVATACPVCGGSGKIRSSESIALSVLRLLQASLAKATRVSQVSVGLPLDVAVLLLNRKRRLLLELETDFDTSVVVFAEPALQPTQYYIEIRTAGGTRVETNLPDDFPRSALKATAGLPTGAVRTIRPASYALISEGEEEIPEVPDEPPEESTGEAGADRAKTVPASQAGDKPGKKRKRRRRKKKPAEGEAAAPQMEEGAPSAAEPPPAAAASEEPTVSANTAGGDRAAEASAERKLSPSAKRRLRRRRKKALTAVGTAPAGPGEPAPPSETPPRIEFVLAPRPHEPPTPAAGASALGEASPPEAGPEPRKPQTPRARRRKPPARTKPEEPLAGAGPQAAVEASSPEEPPQASPGADAAPRKRKPRPRRKAQESKTTEPDSSD